MTHPYIGPTPFTQSNLEFSKFPIIIQPLLLDFSSIFYEPQGLPSPLSTMTTKFLFYLIPNQWT